MAEYSPSTDRLATVFGGSGFVGRHIVRALARDGWRIRVAVRRPDLAGFLRPLGVVGQIELVQANLRYPDSIAAALEDADAVVNAAGIQRQGGRQTYEAVHAAGAGAIARAAAAAGIGKLVHVSGVGADARSPNA
jgi:NADH dehydrogenase